MDRPHGLLRRPGSFAEFIGSALVVGDGNHGFGGHAAIVEKMPQPGRHRAGLARAGRCDDSCRSSHMQRCSALIVCKRVVW